MAKTKTNPFLEFLKQNLVLCGIVVLIIVTAIADAMLII